MRGTCQARHSSSPAVKMKSGQQLVLLPNQPDESAFREPMLERNSAAPRRSSPRVPLPPCRSSPSPPHRRAAISVSLYLSPLLPVLLTRSIRQYEHVEIGFSLRNMSPDFFFCPRPSFHFAQRACPIPPALGALQQLKFFFQTLESSPS